MPSFVACFLDKGEETKKRILKVLGSAHKQHRDTFSNQTSEVLKNDPIDDGSAVTTVDVNKDEEDLMKRTRDHDTDKLDGSAVTTVDVNKDEEDLMKRTRDQDTDKLDGSAVTTVDVNKDEEDLMKRTRDQDTDKLDLNTTDDDKTDDKNSSSFSPNPLKNEDMLIKELKVCLCFFFKTRNVFF